MYRGTSKFLNRWRRYNRAASERGPTNRRGLSGFSPQRRRFADIACWPSCQESRYNYTCNSGNTEDGKVAGVVRRRISRRRMLRSLGATLAAVLLPPQRLLAAPAAANKLIDVHCHLFNATDLPAGDGGCHQPNAPRAHRFDSNAGRPSPGARKTCPAAAPAPARSPRRVTHYPADATQTTKKCIFSHSKRPKVR